jgi:signal transduction histidine kinase/CheY-like chemotaxis protein
LGVVLVFRDVSRDNLERARREFLAQAGEALVSSLDYQSTLRTVTRLAVPAIADWCSINILEPGAEVPYQAAVAHADPHKLELARRLGERFPPDPAAPRGAAAVIRSGKSELYEEITPGMLEASARGPEHLSLVRELDLRSAMVVPLRAREHTLGAMSFAYAESRRRYGREDLSFAEDFARRAAMAIENALALRQVDQARTQERRLRADAEIASRAKDAFLAMVSHELRTPLNAILGWAVLLRTPGNQEKAERGLAVIERNARAQAKLIDDVLDVSRIISGKLSLSLGPTNVSDAITASVETVAPAADAKGIRIEASLPAEPLTITADAERVQQVVWNLLSNAVKFTPKGGNVRIEGSVAGSDVRIVVTDTGEGIRRELLDAVFAPFQQADTSTTRRHGGLGLGLAIVKQLVAAHGGTVHAESDGIGQGARFVVELPARATAAARPTPDQAISTTPGANPSPPLEGLVILVVDDEEDALQLVTRVLSAHGAEVHAVASAREALEKIETVHPDVLVSDIGMPEEDGYSLIRKVRALPHEQGGRTLAVALTAYARREDALRAFAAGYQRHVAKPIEPAELARVVANLGGRDVRAE